jgi:hypothetical protein
MITELSSGMLSQWLDMSSSFFPSALWADSLTFTSYFWGHLETHINDACEAKAAVLVYFNEQV